MSHLNSTSYVVTLLIGESQKTELWSGQSPLPLGRPLRWVLEKKNNQIRLRNLGSLDQPSSPSQTKVITDSEISQNLEIALSAGIALRIKPTQPSDPVFLSRPMSQIQDYLTAYTCKGNWITHSTALAEKFIAHAGEITAFSLTQEGGLYRLAECHPALVGAQAGSFNSTQLSALELKFANTTWRFGHVEPTSYDDSKKSGDDDNRFFKQAIRATIVGLGAFIAMTWFIPKPNHKAEETIPPQFAKIVLTPAAKSPAQMAPSGAIAQSSSTQVTNKTVEKTAVVQAFRAKALQNAVSGLLKGGMTSLLAQSDFVAGTKQSASARSLFNTKAQALQASAAGIGETANRNVAIASLGGDASGGAGGSSGVGYGKGEHAGVHGQGKSLVSMDLPNANVEEGLTKDEVGEVIHRHLSEVRYCYESAMLRQSDIEGKLMVAFTIGGQGQAKDAAVKQSSLPDARLDDCIIRRLVTWKFPNPKGGSEVAVTYPFLFKTLGR